MDIDVPSAVEVFTTLRYINLHLLTYYYLEDYQTAEYLSLAKRDGVELFSFKSFVVGEFQQRHGRVGAVRQNEDKWSEGTRVVERLFQVERRRFHETLAEFSRHVVSHRRNHLIRYAIYEL